MKIILSYLKQHKKTLIFSLLLAAVSQIFSLLDPQIFRIIVDNYINRVEELTKVEFLQGAGLLLLAGIGVAFVSRVAKAFQDYYVNVTTQRVGTSLYGDSISHAFGLPFGVFEDQSSGELLNKIQKMRTDTQNFISQMINTVFLSLVGIIFVIGYASYVHPYVGIAYFLLIPLLGSIIYFLSKKIKNTQARIVRATSELAGQTTETIRNVELVKSLGLEEREIARLNEVNEQILSLELEKVKYVRSLDFIQGTLTNFLRSLIQLLLLWLIFQRSVSEGEFFTLFFYSFYIFGPLSALGMVAASYQEAKASSEQLEKILALPLEEIPENTSVVEEIKSIAFDHVDFSYRSSPERKILNKVSLDVKSGQTVALVGPSGSGKSTIIKLLAGLYQPEGGEITINNIPLNQIDRNSLRARIGLVAQETQLFSGSIKTNLLFVNPQATDEDCLNALQSASLDSLLARSEKGIDTIIGEGGVKISGGERQRLAIARALLRNPDIIIFDEATSSLDTLTEHEITETIKSITKDRPNLITVIIAHRLSTTAHADKIYVLEKGSIVEEGTHEELVKNSQGLYEALWKGQTAV